jgi:hypothetical protein
MAQMGQGQARDTTLNRAILPLLCGLLYTLCKYERHC